MTNQNDREREFIPPIYRFAGAVDRLRERLRTDDQTRARLEGMAAINCCAIAGNCPPELIPLLQAAFPKSDTELR